MSQGYAVPQPGQPPAKVRPAIVTIADALLLLVAAMFVVGFIMTLSIIGTMTQIFEEEFAGTEAEGTEGIITATLIGGAVFNLLIAVGLVVLAILNNQGKNPARIVTWVLGGIGLCCSGVSLLGSGLGSGFGGADTSGVDEDQLNQRLEDALPSWYEPANLTILVVSVLALAVALLLLALPPSNEFFRKQPPPFEPPPAYPQVG